MNPVATELAIEWLRGFLHAFAYFNNKTNHGYTFNVDILAKPDSARAAVQRHFGDDLRQLELSPIEDWKRILRQVFERWLFQFSDRSEDHLRDMANSFSLFSDYFRGMLLDELVQKVAAIVSPEAVWNVRVDTRGWYECHYEDVAFEEQSRVVYLHLGVSD